MALEAYLRRGAKAIFARKGSEFHPQSSFLYFRRYILIYHVFYAPESKWISEFQYFTFFPPFELTQWLLTSY